VNESHHPCLAVAGYGPWGRNHVRTARTLGALVAVCEPDPTRRAEAARDNPDVAVHADLADALADPRVTGVVLATPAATHVALARQALDAGRDVLTEKPLALAVDEARALAAHAAARGRVLMVGHVLEYHPALAVMARVVRDGVIGRLRYVTSTRLNLGRVREEENVLWSFAPHDFSLLLRVSGELPEEIAAAGGAFLRPGHVDECAVMLGFPSGLRALVHVSWLHPFKEHRLVVVGERGALAWEPTASAGAPLRLWRHQVEWSEGGPVTLAAPAEPLAYEDDPPLRRELQAFLRAIETRDPPPTDAASAVQVLELLAAAERSLAAGGRPVPRESAPRPACHVHPTAIVDEGARIGAGTRVWHFAHVMAGARIGARCVLGQNVFVAAGVTMGDGCKLQNNVSLYDRVELEDDVFCGPSCVFTNVRRPRAHVERKHAYEPTRVGRGASIGANATIVCGTTLGPYAFVAAGAVVTKDVPPHAIVMGAPAKVRGWACACGESLDLPASPSEGQRATCHQCAAGYVWTAGGVQRAAP
jgi:UDP-2-acetamido-3-amino-2,3-dideoxy-glucuronate N-acetyltransferase